MNVSGRCIKCLPYRARAIILQAIVPRAGDGRLLSGGVANTPGRSLHHKLRKQCKYCTPLPNPSPFCASSNSISITGHRLYTVAVTSSDEPQRLLLIQPVHKFGPIPRPYVPPRDRLDEAEALVEAITGWEVHSKRTEAVRLQIHSQHYFGTGKIEELKRDVRNLGEKITGVFVNVPLLTPLQHSTFRSIFRKDVFDRFGIVLQIFKERAQTREAKLQVELAEVPYTYSRFSIEDERGRRKEEGEIVSKTVRKYQMNRRLKQLEKELEGIRNRRKLLREHRARHSTLPIVAVVGYTNAGKTTLIKALSKDSSMVPRDILFATLDSTHHAGKLSCGLTVLYVDTIGFVSDLPVELVESFSATLEDSINAICLLQAVAAGYPNPLLAIWETVHWHGKVVEVNKFKVLPLLQSNNCTIQPLYIQDVLVHVIDGSHPLAYAQRENVLDVLNRLDVKPELMDNIINVVNKIDKISEEKDWKEGDILVSATEGTSLTFLKMKLQEQVLRATNQKLWDIQVPAAGPHLSWLHGSDACLVEVGPAEGGDQERLQVKVLLTGPTLRKFVSKFADDNITMTVMTQRDSMKLTAKKI